MSIDPAEPYAVGQLLDRVTRAVECLAEGNPRGALACINEAGAWLDDAITAGTRVPWLLEGDDAIVPRLETLARTLTAQIERS